MVFECVVQGEVLSFGDDTRKKTAMKPVKKGGDKDQQMGSALRSVYQKTVDEAVPDEMLALLGKLD
ncbi:NepR family anti-sigma factor [Sphingomonas sp. PB2P19]